MTKDEMKDELEEAEHRTQELKQLAQMDHKHDPTRLFLELIDDYIRDAVRRSG